MVARRTLRKGQQARPIAGPACGTPAPRQRHATDATRPLRCYRPQMHRALTVVPRVLFCASAGPKTGCNKNAVPMGLENHLQHDTIQMSENVWICTAVLRYVAVLKMEPDGQKVRCSVRGRGSLQEGGAGQGAGRSGGQARGADSRQSVPRRRGASRQLSPERAQYITRSRGPARHPAIRASRGGERERRLRPRLGQPNGGPRRRVMHGAGRGHGRGRGMLAAATVAANSNHWVRPLPLTPPCARGPARRHEERGSDTTTPATARPSRVSFLSSWHSSR